MPLRRGKNIFGASVLVNKASTTAYSEDFTMANQTGWPSPWFTQSHDENNDANFKIASNQAVIEIPLEEATGTADLKGIEINNSLIELKFTLSHINNDLQPTFHFRTSGLWSEATQKIGYWVWLYSGRVYLGKTTSSGNSIISDTAKTLTADTQYNLKIEARSGLIKVKIWAGSEPGWDIEASDNQFTKGGFSVKIVEADPTVDSPDSITTSLKIDDITITNEFPTSFTSGSTIDVGMGVGASASVKPAASSFFVSTNSIDTVYGQSVSGSVTKLSNQGYNIGDRKALADFYVAMDGPNWDNNTGWSSDYTQLDLTTMFGVVTRTVNSEVRVDELNLSGGGGTDDQNILGNNLSGSSIPDSFGNLKQMRQLRLKGNNITARVDNWIQDLTSIVALRLSNNSDVNGQSEFDYMDRGRYNHEGKTADAYNLWSGGIPDDLSMLTSLELFECALANLTGSLPTKLPDSIRAVILHENRMDGTLPEWSNATLMSHIYLANRYKPNDQFSGPIPAGWNNMDMAWLNLNNNQLNGDMPQFSGWSDLRNIDIASNDLSGPEPSNWLWNEPGRNTNLHTVGTSFNNWDGGVLQTFGGDNNQIAAYNTNRNDSGLTGTVPAWYGQKRISQLVQDDNQFDSMEEGSLIPDRNKLYWFQNNNISSELPGLHPDWDEGGNFRIKLENNRFYGSIPDSWAGATGSTFNVYINLHNNLLDGVIPSWLANFGTTYPLTLQDNKFTPKDIVPNLSAIEAATSSYTYTPQKNFGTDSGYTAGDTIDLSSFDYTNNSYQWYDASDDSALSGETANTLDTTSYGAGSYYMTIDHPDITYTFTSVTFTVS